MQNKVSYLLSLLNETAMDEKPWLLVDLYPAKVEGTFFFLPP
jgi:hypothetical protein